MDRRYDTFSGPPRDARHSLEQWHAAQDQAEAVQVVADRRAVAALPDVYQVADRVLGPLLRKLRSVPRRLRVAAIEQLGLRGEKPTRPNLLREAARMVAQERAAEDSELALALLLRAALLFRPEGGWSHRSDRKRPEGFGSLGELLSAAFSEVALGAGAIPLECAQNRARTRSNADEVFVQPTHTGSSQSRNAGAVDRRTDAQALILRSEVDLRLVPLLFERHVLGRFRTRAELVDEMRTREAKRRRVAGLLVNPDDPTDVRDGTVHQTLPPRPGADATDVELAAWRLAVGVALWGEHPKQKQHIRRHDRALVRPVDEAEVALTLAIGRSMRPARRSAQRSREVTGA